MWRLSRLVKRIHTYTDADGTKLSILSCKEFCRHGVSNPLFTLHVDAAAEQPSKPISSLSAGDAHFSFIFTYTSTSLPKDMEEYYTNVWCIRTDSRAHGNTAWLNLEQELSALEDPPPIRIETIKPEIRVLCAYTNEFVDFVQCVSAGWMTAAVCEQERAWIFPFGMAMSIVPDLPVGEIMELEGVISISVGSTHVAVVKRSQEGKEVWTFGLNDHGQRGLPPETSQNEWSGNIAAGWKKLELGSAREVRQVKCGKLNTFIVTESRVPN